MVAAMRSPTDASAAIVSSARERVFEMAATATLFFKYEAVMTRSEHLKTAGLGVPDVAVILDRLAAVIVPVRIWFSWRPLVNDPEDDMVLEAAANARADALVTFETATFMAEAKRFGIDVLTPGQAWDRIRA